MVERALQYDILSYFLDETYIKDVPPFYSMKSEEWKDRNYQYMAINAIKKYLRDAPPWLSPKEVLTKMYDDISVDLGLSMSQGKRNKNIKDYYEVIYYMLDDILNYLYLCELSPEDG